MRFPRAAAAASGDDGHYLPPPSLGQIVARQVPNPQSTLARVLIAREIALNLMGQALDEGLVICSADAIVSFAGITYEVE